MPLKVTVKDLPSGGRGYSIDSVMLTPMTFKQMLDYDATPSFLYVQRLQRDLDMIAKDVRLEDISSFDVDALIFLKKCISFAKTSTVSFTFVCPFCKDEQVITMDLENLDYDLVDKEIFNITKIKIGGIDYPVSIPNAKSLYETIDKFLMFKEVVDPRIVSICNVLQFNSLPGIKQKVENSTYDEILMLSHLADMFMGSRKLVNAVCDRCGKEVRVGVDMLSPNMFQDLRLNQKIEASKIYIPEGL